MLRSAGFKAFGLPPSDTVFLSVTVLAIVYGLLCSKELLCLLLVQGVVGT
ncbi:hypothetical protein A2U01_0096580, partial [Trifolium medium]|nr:hypothetical protein [Trifolium medium]